MKNFKTLSLMLAAVVFAGFCACSGTNKEVKDVADEAVVETEMVSDSVVVADSTMMEEPVAEEAEVVEME